jgi:hypothetical protein
MKKVISFVLVLGLLLSPAYIIASNSVDKDEATDKCSASGVVVGGARELGLLVMGITWEAVRIVLPEWCPAKEKDIDQLLSETD